MSDRRPAGAGLALIIDDAEEMREIMRFAAEAEGLVVEEVATSAAALARVKGPRPALIILDLNLGDQAGEVVARAFDLHFGASVPIVIVSGEANARERTQGLRGVVANLAKPFDLDALRTLVRDLVPPR